MAKRLVYDFDGNDRGLGRTLDQLGDKWDQAGRSMDRVRDSSKRLDQQIDDTQGRIRGLANELARTDKGSEAFKSLSKQMRDARRELGQLNQWRQALSMGGEQGAQGFFAGFSQRIGPLLLKAPVSAPLLAGLVGAAPVISSVVAGAVTAGVAAASVGAGLAIAFKAPAVKEAGKTLAAELGQDLKDAAAPFVPATLNAIGIVRSEFRTLKPVLADIFGTAAPHLETLTRGATAAVKELAVGFRDANRNAEPLIDVIGEQLPEVGRTAGDALRTLSSDAENSADAFRGLLTVTEMAVGGTATLISFLNKIGPAVAAPIYAIGDLAEKEDKAADATQVLTGWTGKYDAAAEGAAKATKTLNEELREHAEAASGAFDAATDLGEAMDRMSESLKENGRTHDQNTEKGRANRQALMNLKNAILENVNSLRTLKGSQGEAQQAMDAGYRAFVKAAEGAGYTKRQADALARSLGLIPRSKSTTFTFPGLIPGISNAETLKRRIDALRSKSIRIDTHYFYTSSGFHVPGGTILRQHGGIVPGPPVRRDVVPAMLTPGEGVVNLSGMRRIGGEAGLNAINSGRGASAGGEQTIRIVIDGTGLLTGLRKEIAIQGGDVQQVLGR